MNNKNIIVLLAAGAGIRFGHEVPKQFTTICGKSILEITLEKILKSNESNRIILVLDSVEREGILQKHHSYIDVIQGGSERKYSFQKALDYIYIKYPECKKVVFHEAARPLVGADTIDKYFELLDEYDYVESCKKITDSLGSYSIKAPDRNDYYLIQAPEAYRIDVLRQYFDCNSDIYYAANQFPDECRGYQYYEIKNNIKLTYPEDKYLIDFLLRLENGN